MKSTGEPIWKPYESLRALWRRIRRSYQGFRTATNPVHTRLTRAGWQFWFMIGFILLGAALRSANLLVILAGTLIGMLFIHWRICSRSLLHLEVERRLPRAIQARRPFEIELTLRNRKSWLGAWLVLVQDRMVYSPLHATIHTASQTIQLLYSSVPPNASRSGSYQCTAQRRGRYQWLGIEITTRFPLGLMRGILQQKESNTLIVQPAIGKLTPAWKDLFLKRQVSSRQRQTRSLSDEGDFFGLRAYRSGDSRRWIHWRSSARRDELVVKQFQQPDNRELIILLDLIELTPDSSVPEEKYQDIEDKAVEFVATMVHHITASNIGSVTVAICDANPTIACRVASKSQAYFLQERLATAGGLKGTGPQDVTKLVETLRLLEREVREIDQLLVVSTRKMPQDLISTLEIETQRVRRGEATESGTHRAFWRSVRWVHVRDSELEKFFTAAQAVAAPNVPEQGVASETGSDTKAPKTKAS